MKQIAFVESDKYIVAKEYQDIAPFKPEKAILTSYGVFYPNGEYVIKAGFLFSASWPAMNTFDTRRAACVHDYFYNLMKDGHLPRIYRKDVDKLFHKMLREDGMNLVRAKYWYLAVRIGGDKALDSPAPKIQYSPSNIPVPNINKHVGLVNP
jgi:hypothetical protein